jgi:methylmalonyl-CoA mutase C-terminal domain/subunit
MVRDRIVVGSTGPDESVRQVARRLRDEGHEVVFVGGGQTPEQLVATCVAEDAARIVVDTDDAGLAAIRSVAQAQGEDAPVVDPAV